MLERKTEEGIIIDNAPPPAAHFGDSEKIEEFVYDPSRKSYQGSNDTTSIQHGTKRSLKARHVQMIALGGTIGTGLFLNSGGNIADAGPAGAFIAYCVIGFMVYCIMTCLGEMATLIPVSGSFNHYATRFIDPALGFALGWNYCVVGCHDCYRNLGCRHHYPVVG
ncbi:amino acid permease-domain-containing protein [Syncephalastrum racemosum]|uniref:Amino acid permease-domain-containing protein n=1 Tax=Syncephalastrum racemosum TaxID=13706 RepID=A0A1X2H7F4_SYNRA|nr:amino acid permease-domain-containing protein [Syncephalastrum racemosum]